MPLALAVGSCHDQKIRYVGLQVCVQSFSQSECQEFQVFQVYQASLSRSGSLYQVYQVFQVYQASLSRGGSLFQEFQVYQVCQVGDSWLCARIPSK